MRAGPSQFGYVRQCEPLYWDGCEEQRVSSRYTPQHLATILRHRSGDGRCEFVTRPAPLITHYGGSSVTLCRRRIASIAESIGCSITAQMHKCRPSVPYQSSRGNIRRDSFCSSGAVPRERTTRTVCASGGLDDGTSDRSDPMRRTSHRATGDDFATDAG